MVDFIGSFNKGLSAAQQAEKNREEIYSVLESLNKQLEDASKGTVKIDVLQKTIPLFEMFTNPKTTAKPYSFLAAFNPLAEIYKPSELAKWALDPNGYPCLITTEEGDIYCEDKSGLERGLQILISSPMVGEKIYSVMKQKLKAVDDPF
ncbi:hypothetical protein [Pseudomonas nunensis]|uniref:SseB protein N-terminal domain-containing protein n=1 Tax=Pseudomonas nunensis TaxID=2961896 RepID=A0ABY5EBS6_9PSED|nr:hypothetical protein [Pseudomonas nunensis]KPN91689.1 hypothetical protein AL066_15645 [Pseudomonas nunensis]MCL5229615.1 hypothetical protein [Pseudomonas nunensis]UTO11893.1 hypothetical protein NK667_17080 [Pseudomonas nunensis]